MPVVMSYESVEALGALAYQGGYAGYRMADQARADSLVANRQQQDTQRMAMRTAEQQANADRRLQGRLMNQQAGLAQQQLDLGYAELGNEAAMLDARLQASREIAAMNAQGSIAERLIQAQTQQQRDAQGHQYRMTEIEARGTRDATGAPITPQGTPTPDQSEREVHQFGHLVPYNIGSAVSGSDANRRREASLEQAQGFAQLPTDQLESYVSQRPSDQWTPYIRAIIQARGNVAGGGANPEGPARPQTNAGAFSPPTTSAGYGLDNLTTAELHALANNPELMSQWMGTPGGTVQRGTQ